MATTLVDIARETGLAIGSVADVLRGRPGYAEKTRKRILDAAARLNYVPNHMARSLLLQRSHTIGVLTNLSGSAVIWPMLNAMARTLLGQGFMPLFLPIGPSLDSLERSIFALRGRSVDGLIFDTQGFEPEFHKVVPKDLPCVLIGDIASSTWPSVVSDRSGAIAHGVRWLAQRGHRRIVFIGAENAESMNTPYNTNRLKIVGYESAMAKLGLQNESLVIDVGRSDPGATRDFLIRQPEFLRRATAVIAANDRLAIEVMSALEDLGRRVPEDVSLIGFDDTEFAMAVRPRLTTFQPRRADVGASAAKLMMKLLDDKPARSISIVPKLMERDSTRPLPVPLKA